MFGPGPTLAGFLAFIRSVMGIDPIYLPDDAPINQIALNVALGIVNRALRSVPAGALNQPPPYVWAVYNLAGSTLINFAQDQAGRTFFRDKRAELGVNKFQAGVVSTSSDVSTSTGLATPEFMMKLTMRDLQTLKDPYGREYMMIAQAYGPTIVALS